jgi:hypothetical protein
MFNENSLIFEVFWVVTSCIVVGYQHFRGPLKCWYPTTALHAVTTHKTST